MNWFKSFWKKPAPPAAKGTPASTEHKPTFFTWAKQYLAAAQKTAETSSHDFTPRAVEILASSRKEPRRLNHNFVGTEHLLLALIQLDNGVSITLLKNHGLGPETACQEIEKYVGKGPEMDLTGQIPYTPRVRKVLALAMREGRALSHPRVGPEHILLGLLSEGDGVAARIMQNHGLDLQTARNEVMKDFGQIPPPSDAQKPPDSPKYSFMPQAVEMLALARQEAQRLGHNFTDTEHFLIAYFLLNQGASVAFLKTHGLDLETARQEILKLVPAGTDQTPAINIPFTPLMKKSLALGAREAQALNHLSIYPEHILLGLLREGDGIAGRILRNHNLDRQTLRDEIKKSVSQIPPPAIETQKPSEPPPEKPPESPIA